MQTLFKSGSPVARAKNQEEARFGVRDSCMLPSFCQLECNWSGNITPESTPHPLPRTPSPWRGRSPILLDFPTPYRFKRGTGNAIQGKFCTLVLSKAWLLFAE